MRIPFFRILPGPGPIALIGLVLLCQVTLAGCSRRPPKIDKQVQRAYQANAHRMCLAMLECIRQDARRALQKSPERKAMVLSRMNRELCLKNQYRMIGRADSRAGMLPPIHVKSQVYRLYARCADAVTASSDCAARKQARRNHKDCKALDNRIRRR